MSIDRMDRLEEQLAHQSALMDELNNVVTTQASQIDILQRRITLLMKRAAEQESDSISGVPVQDQKPPHW
ncbi:MAG: SlyX family protein [Rhodobacteraceae bacterium]|nr:SlyX family protein [Paracoccaceae bacterium]